MSIAIALNAKGYAPATEIFIFAAFYTPDPDNLSDEVGV
jgi:hypothetical protein